uniref:Apolipoprotein D n=1 Tax=Hucho hucho TaxID=62062 RepID=A0A4W5JGB2_9TELE
FSCIYLLIYKNINMNTVHLGRCPTPPVQQDFNVTKVTADAYGVCQYLGRWYEVEKLPAVFERGKCQQATYSLLREMWSQSQSQPQLAPSLPGDPYLVLSTDYSDFSLVCSVDFGWIVSRTRSLPSDVISRLHGDLEAIGVDLRCLTVSDQTGCKTVA